VTHLRSASPAVAFRALGAASLTLLGCSDFETVGTLPPEAGMLSPPVPDAAPVNEVTLDQCLASAASGDAAAPAVVRTDAGGLGWLYPYAGTVFPGGFAPPLVMWSGPGGDAVFLRLHSSSFDYASCLKPSAPGQVAFPPEAWALAESATTGSRDPFSLELTVLAEGQVLGPITEPLILAPGALDVAVYYMTLGSGLTAPGGNLLNLGVSSILRVRPPGSAELVLSSGSCDGCHSLSADGSRLLAYASGNGASYALAASSSMAPTLLANPAPGAEYAGVVPDGTLYLASARPQGVGPRAYAPAPSVTAILYETATGQRVDAAGIRSGSMVPSFSRDGTLLAFNDFALNQGRGLALMDFSESGRAATNYRTLLTEPSRYPAWPSFLPDDGALVFSLGDGADFSGGGTGVEGIITAGPQTDLYLVDTSGHPAILLARAMGFDNADLAASDTTYLPFGLGDAHQNFYPSVAPAPSGGFAWVFFDSRRNYGNLGLQRAVWGAALDLSSGGGYTSDPSHPAFYLPGQELGTGNFRAVAASAALSAGPPMLGR
jgi:hypothetical protein